jgi:hypothetical protein
MITATVGAHRGATPKVPFLGVDDYGTGGIWFVLLARSEVEAHDALPEVRIFPPGVRPDWMSEDSFQQIAEHRTFDIDALLRLDQPPEAAPSGPMRCPHKCARQRRDRRKR